MANHTMSVFLTAELVDEDGDTDIGRVEVMDGEGDGIGRIDLRIGEVNYLIPWSELMAAYAFVTADLPAGENVRVSGTPRQHPKVSDSPSPSTNRNPEWRVGQKPDHDEWPNRPIMRGDEAVGELRDEHADELAERLVQPAQPCPTCEKVREWTETRDRHEALQKHPWKHGYWSAQHDVLAILNGEEE